MGFRVKTPPRQLLWFSRQLLGFCDQARLLPSYARFLLNLKAEWPVSLKP